MKKKLLTEAQIKRMATIAGIPALNRISEKVVIQNEEAEETTQETTNEEIVAEEEEMEMDAEAPEGEEVSQEKIESLVDAVLAAIEAETGVPAQRVDDEGPAEDEPEMDAEEPAEEPEEEMIDEAEPTLAERIAAAVQSVLDEDAGIEESNCSTNEEEIEEGKHEDKDEV